MTWTEFGRKMDALNASETAQFTAAVRRLLAEGWLWRDDADDATRAAYHFLMRHQDLAREYLLLGGWELSHIETARIFHVRHVDGRHRRVLSKETTLWLLLVRLIYQEQREQERAALTPNPSIAVRQLYERYLNYFPNERVRAKTQFTEALRELQHLGLVRVPAGGAARADTPDKLLELLPTLEVMVPPATIAELTELMKPYQAAPTPPEAE